jgi:hypothetical protein
MRDEAEIRERSGADRADEDTGVRLARMRASNAVRSVIRVFLLGLISFGPIR